VTYPSSQREHIPAVAPEHLVFKTGR